MSGDSKKQILEKIEKLMAMANDTSSINEAEVAAKKAQELLLKFNLTMQDVNSNVDERETLVGDELFEMGKIWKKVEGNWIQNLYSVVARNNLCRIILRPKHGGRNWTVIGKDIWVIGRAANVELVNFMCQQLIPRIRNIEKKSWNEYQGWDKRGKYRRGFLIGCVHGIGQQLYAQMNTMKKEHKNLHALIVVNDKAVDAFVANKWPKLGNSRGGSTSSHDGYSQGKAAGKSMSIHKGVGGTTTRYGGLFAKPK